MRPFVLSIAGFDPSGGAGLLADAKAMEQQHVQGLGVCTAITIQNEDTFIGSNWVETSTILSQIEILHQKYDISTIKIGLIENLEVLHEIVMYLQSWQYPPIIIWDPVLKASAGFSFHEELPEKLLRQILEHIWLITPNANEWEKIIEVIPLEDMTTLCHVLLKGGHKTDDADEILYMKGGREIVFEGERIEGAEKHGTGCIMSSVIAAELAKGHTLQAAIAAAKEYVKNYLVSSKTLLGVHQMTSA